MPFIYGIFAIWNLPLYFLGLLPSPDFVGPSRLIVQIFWSKLLLVIFYFLPVKILSLISRGIRQCNSLVSYRPVAILFATSPIAVLVVFAFGQYDIIGVFLVLLGFYFYLKKNLWLFALFFAVAISFKYFALVIYVPLILMVEKNPLKILKWLIVAGSIVAIQVLLYAHSDIFLGEIFTLFKSKVIGEHQDRISLFKQTIYMVVLYFFGCTHLYFKKYASYEWQRDAVFAPIVAYALMFSAVVWYPQWLVITMLFLRFHIYIFQIQSYRPLLMRWAQLCLFGFVLMCGQIILI